MDVQNVVDDARSAIDDLTTHTGMPSASPLMGLSIPIKRTIPMDLHSLLDYGNALEAFALGAFSKSPAAKMANYVVGTKTLGISLMTDYRLSLVKWVPIEVHEMADYTYGVAMLTTPFLFGYWKTEPVITALQVAMGVTTIFASLFTDYRAQRGVKWGLPIVRRGTR